MDRTDNPDKTAPQVFSKWECPDLKVHRVNLGDPVTMVCREHRRWEACRDPQDRLDLPDNRECRAVMAHRAW